MLGLWMTLANVCCNLHCLVNCIVADYLLYISLIRECVDLAERP